MAKRKLNKTAQVREFLRQHPEGTAAEYNKWAPPAAKMPSNYFHNLRSAIRRSMPKSPRQKVESSESAIPALSAPREAPRDTAAASYTAHQLHAARTFAEEFGDFDSAIGALKMVQSLFATGLPKAVDIT